MMFSSSVQIHSFVSLPPQVLFPCHSAMVASGTLTAASIPDEAKPDQPCRPSGCLGRVSDSKNEQNDSKQPALWPSVSPGRSVRQRGWAGRPSASGISPLNCQPSGSPRQEARCLVSMGQKQPGRGALRLGKAPRIGKQAGFRKEREWAGGGGEGN
ncbi:hypothetical protein AOLI_G00285340 [Acnodon oligacanthus]